MSPTSTTPQTPRQRGVDDAPHSSPVTPAEDVRSIMVNNVAWGAVFAGAFVGLTTQLIINMIGIGVGAATLDPGTGDNPAVSTLSIGAAVWFGVAAVLGALAGGVTAGRLSGKPKESTARWHGLTSWAVMTMVVIYLVGSGIGGLVGGAASTLSSAAGGIASAAGGAAKVAGNAVDATGANPFASIQQSIESTVPQNADPAQARDAAIAAVRAAVAGSPADEAQAKQQAAQALASAQGIPLPEAQAKIDQYQAQYKKTVEDAKQAAIKAADVAAKATTQTALYASLGMIIAGLAAWFGGGLGAVEPTVTRRRVA